MPWGSPAVFLTQLMDRVIKELPWTTNKAKYGKSALSDWALNKFYFLSFWESEAPCNIELFFLGTDLLLPCMCVLVTQSCLTLHELMGYSPPGSSVHGIFQARIPEWVAIPFSRGSSRPRNLGLLHCRQILYHLSHQGSPQMKKRLLWILNLLTGLIWIS